MLVSRFDAEPLPLTAAKRRTLLSTLAAAGVGGGASYDGLVAMEAAAHEDVLAPSYPSPPCPTPAA